MTHHLKQSQVGYEDVVKVNLRILPSVVHKFHIKALVVVGGNICLYSFSLGIDTLVEAASEQLDAHYTEDEPEDQADEQHVEDGRYGLYKRVHHHLAVTTDRPSDPVSKALESGKAFFLFIVKARPGDTHNIVNIHRELLLGFCYR